MKPQILYSKWRDPFIREGEQDDYDEDYQDELEDGYGDRHKRWGKPSPYRGTYLSTPMGFVPLNDNNLPSKQFSLWIANCNFELTPEHERIIETSPGVEVLRMMTRYRFLFGVGAAFDDDEAKERLSCELTKSWENKHRDAPHWAKVKVGDGTIKTISGPTEFIARKTAEKAGVVIAASWQKGGSNGVRAKTGDGRGVSGSPEEPGQPGGDAVHST